MKNQGRYHHLRVDWVGELATQSITLCGGANEDSGTEQTLCPNSGCLREGAKSYVKRLRPERESALGQRYSPVKLMCSHPRGEMWARNSASPSFSVFQ